MGFQCLGGKKKVTFNPIVETFEYVSWDDEVEDDEIFEKSRKRKISGSAFVNPLLNPVTNISQWKALKAKTTTLLRPNSPRRSPKYFGRRISVAQEMNSVRIRNSNVNPLLNPIENLAQWKALKAKTTTLLRPNSPRRSPKYFGRRISVAQEMNSVRIRNSNVNPLLNPIENLAQGKALKAKTTTLLRPNSPRRSPKYFGRRISVAQEMNSVRIRNSNVNPLLNPIENLAQWKALKAKTTTLLRPNSPRRSPKYFERRISVAQEMNSVRNRNSNVNPLLNPIENLAQWKALKLGECV